MSSTIKPILDAVSAALLAAAPLRIVTRKLEDFSGRDHADLEKGVFTLVSQGRRDEDAHISYLKCLLVGQIVCKENDGGDVIEESELLMIDDMQRLIDGVHGCQIKPKSPWQQSQQIEAPYGWVSVELEIGPFDLSIGLDLSTLSDFTAMASDFDVAPHVSAAEHIKWIGGDYTTSKPELKDQQTL